MTAIDGMHDDESALFLSFLNRHIENPNFHTRWSWRPGDLAIWDERCTNHRALGSLPAVPADAPLHGEGRSARARIEGCTLNAQDEIRDPDVPLLRDDRRG